MMINVIYPDGHRGVVTSATLTYFIENQVIAAFQRSDGWISINDKAVRRSQQPFDGPDRRAYAKPSPQEQHLTK